MQTDVNEATCKYAQMDEAQESARRTALDAMEKTGLDATKLARLAGLAPGSTLTRFLAATEGSRPAKVKHTLSGRTLTAILTAAESYQKLDNLPDAPETPNEARRVAPAIPHSASLPRDVPVFGAAQGGPLGINQVTQGFPVDYVARYPVIAGAKNVFAIYLEGDSMIPWNWPGDLIYINPDKPPKPGNHVLVEISMAKMA